MKAELQNKLLEKYSHFFQNELPIYAGDSTKEVLETTVKLLKQEEIVLPIQFGFECGDGWYMLLDNLMNEIDNHLKNVNNINNSVFKYQWMWKLQYQLRIRTSSTQKRLRKLGDWIYEKAPRKKLPEITIKIEQIKEKYGGLSFYYSGGDEAIEGMVSLAESLSYQICEYCGNTKNIGYTKGWISAMCENCYENHPNKDHLKWEAKK